MKIFELFESTRFKESDFIEVNNKTPQINYNLVEDLVHFMMADDSVYRKCLYPKILISIKSFKNPDNIPSDYFKDSVLESYKEYLRKYPIKILPRTLDTESLHEACDKIYEIIVEDLSERTS